MNHTAPLDSQPTAPASPLSPTARVALGVALAIPVIGLVLLLAAPSADGHWSHHPSHFWLVLGTAVTAGALGWIVGSSARRRRDARLALVSMSFLASAAFLGLHALATPRVLLDGSTAGFVIAVPVGLLISSGFAMWSALPLEGARAEWVIAHLTALRLALLAVVAVWAICSVAQLPPLDGSATVESGSLSMVALGLPAAAGFGVAAWRYLGLARSRRSHLLVAIAAAWILLAEAAVAVSVTEGWRASWWLWHVLMVAAFVTIAVSAMRLPELERFSDLYLADVASGRREITVLFADLKGFTKFSERHSPDQVQDMLNTYLHAVLPAIRSAGGRLDRLIGDAVMVTFNVLSEQPDHAHRAARAAIGFREAASTVAEREPDWPTFRIGMHTGEAAVGLLGDDWQRDYTVLGDTVNVAAHIEGLAPAGAIAMSDATRRAVPNAVVESLGVHLLKTRTDPVEIWRLIALDD